MISRGLRTRLWIFVALTVFVVTATYVGYMRGLERLGIGVYDVTLELPDAGGLYPHAQVSYRGVDVGSVTRLEARQDRVVAHLRLDSSSQIPSDLDAYVRSTSAIGEQYVNLVPRPGTGDDPVLVDGATIARDRVVLPTSTADLLQNTEALLGSLPKDALSDVIDAFGTTFDGTSDDLARLFDSSMELLDVASANLDPTIALLDNLQPVLSTLDATSPETAVYLSHLRRLTDVLVRRDGDIRALVKEGSPFMKTFAAELKQIRAELPGVLADTRTLANVTSTYDENIEHILTVFPAVVSALQSTIPPERLDDEMPLANLSIKIALHDPPYCTTGFPEATSQRSPHDLSPGPDAGEAYCKVPGDDPRVVRGARNIPCPNIDVRSATPAGCGLSFPRYGVSGGAVRASAPGSSTDVVFVDVSRDVVTAADGRRMPLSLFAVDTPAQDLLDIMSPQTRQGENR